MNIRETLESGHSRANTQKIADHIGGDAARFKELIALFLEGDYRLTQRAAWPISVCAEAHPELIRPYLNTFLDLLPRNDLHNAVKRNVTRLLQFVEIPKKLQGKAYSHCLDLIADPKEFVAVKANAITVALNIARSEPDLMDELRMIIKPQLKGATPALKARVKTLF
ncbi:MAG: hypothetical protein KF685_05040 [Acidobacteria bacterium]|nr:hypothetical protein [Acidobacteriota bacterium]